MDKDEILLQKRLKDLANRSFMQNMYTYSDFLSLGEQVVLWSIKEELKYSNMTLFGGNEESERVMVRFGAPAQLGYEEEYPITCIEIRPFLEKFADDFTHRDFLGALMNLGIKREVIGDIFIQNKVGYVYCMSNMAKYIIENLTKVKRTNVKCIETEDSKNIGKKEKIEKDVTVSSERIDAVVAKVYNMSRTQSLDLFRTKNIFINGKIQENNSYMLKKEDVVSVRGFGKFVYYGMKYETKKGKCATSVGIYV